MAREMKDSGIEWIGEIPKGWEVVKVKNIFKNTKKIVGDREKEFERLALTLKGVLKRDKNDNKGLQSEKFSTYQILEKNELVFKMIDLENKNTSRVGFSKHTGIVSPVYIILNNTKYTRYGYYFFYDMWQRYIFNTLGNNGVRSALNAKDMLNLPFLKLDLREQGKIVNYLDKKVTDIDLIIEKTKTTIENYKKYKQSIITEAVTKGLNPDVEMKDSGIKLIGQIPKQWKIRKIKSFLSVISKGTTPKEISSNKSEKYNIKYIKSENIFNGLVVDIPKFYITSEINEELKRSQLQEDILFVIAGAGIGKTAIMPSSLLPANTNQAVSFLRLKEEYKDYKKYLWYFLQSNILKIYIELFSVQSAQPNLSMENLSNLKISLPEISEVEKIADYLDKKVSEIDNLIFKKESLINEMEEYKKSLIYECVTGKKEII